MSLRETFARIIDPEAFENAELPTRQAIALEKADRILEHPVGLDDLSPTELTQVRAVLDVLDEFPIPPEQQERPH